MKYIFILLSAVKGITNYIIYSVQKDHNLLKKKEVNIFDEED